MNGTHKQIFIVITQTGTMLSRILKRVTGAEYNHASPQPVPGSDEDVFLRAQAPL